jgi:hypothetical protein
MVSELGSPIFNSNTQLRDFSLPRPAWRLLLALPLARASSPFSFQPHHPLCLVHLLPSPLAMEGLIKGLVKVAIDGAEGGGHNGAEEEYASSRGRQRGGGLHLVN